MWKRLFIFTVLACVGLGLVLYSSRNGSGLSYTNFPPRAGTLWVAVGDSLTAGYGAEPGEDYPSILSQRLGVRIENYGASGLTTQDGLERVEEITKLKPRVVLLCLGGNDGLQRLSPGQMFANLGAIIDRIQQTGAFVVLLGVRSASLSDRNEKPFQKLARQKNVLYVPDILHGILGNPELKSDAIHPNAAGYRVIAEKLEEALRPLLPVLLPQEPRSLSFKIPFRLSRSARNSHSPFLSDRNPPSFAWRPLGLPPQEQRGFFLRS